MMLHHRDNVIDCLNFLDKENAYEDLQEARKLLKRSNTFQGDAATDVPLIKLDPKDQAKYHEAIMQHGTPGKKELIQEIKNFFEGPINMDLMLLGAAKSVFEDMIGTGEGEDAKQPSQEDQAKSEPAPGTQADLKKSLGKNLYSLAITLQESQGAVKVLDEAGLIELAYLTLKRNISPEIERVSLFPASKDKEGDQHTMTDFERLLFKIECHIFAQ